MKYLECIFCGYRAYYTHTTECKARNYRCKNCGNEFQIDRKENSQ